MGSGRFISKVYGRREGVLSPEEEKQIVGSRFAVALSACRRGALTSGDSMMDVLRDGNSVTNRNSHKGWIKECPPFYLPFTQQGEPQCYSAPLERGPW